MADPAVCPQKAEKKREDDRKGSKKIAKQSGKERGDFREMENGVANCEGGMKKRELDETNRDGERERELEEMGFGQRVRELEERRWIWREWKRRR